MIGLEGGVGNGEKWEWRKGERRNEKGKKGKKKGEKVWERE